MSTTRLSRAQLEQLIAGFFDAWARHDLDAAMVFMADDALYDEFNQQLWQGKEAVREGFLPQFRGDYGDIQFHVEDLFIDAETQEGLARWSCVFEWKGTRRAWRGLDILKFRDGLIVEKLTYAKTERPLTVVTPLS
jgi:ketosteroid isomerase-like protein